MSFYSRVFKVTALACMHDCVSCQQGLNTGILLSQEARIVQPKQPQGPDWGVRNSQPLFAPFSLSCQITLASVDHAVYIYHSLPHKDKKGICEWRALLCFPVHLYEHSYSHSDRRCHTFSTEEMMG